MSDEVLPPDLAPRTSPTGRASGSCTRRRPPPGSTAPGCATRCSCRAARCAACTATTPTPRPCAWVSARLLAASSRRPGRYRAFISPGGGLTVTGGRAAAPAGVRRGPVRRGQGGLRAAHRAGHLGQRRPPGQRPPAGQHRPGPAGHQGRQSRAVREGQRRGQPQRRPGLRRAPGGPRGRTCGSGSCSCRASPTGPSRSPRSPTWPPTWARIVDRVEVLPYHRLGVDKYAALGRAYPLLGTPAPDSGVGGPGAGHLPRPRPVRAGLNRAQALQRVRRDGPRLIRSCRARVVQGPARAEGSSPARMSWVVRGALDVESRVPRRSAIAQRSRSSTSPRRRTISATLSSAIPMAPR